MPVNSPRSLYRATFASALGAAIAIAWGLFVLPLLGITPGPVPGHEVEAYSFAILPPAIASVLLIGGGIVGVRHRSASDARRPVVRYIVFGAVILCAVIAGGYAVILIRAIFNH